MVSRLMFSEAKMRGVRDDWLSRTIRTVEAVMEQHGFVEDVVSHTKPSAKETMNTLDWNKLFKCFNLLRLS
jgi:hypothetical protein